MIIPIYFTAGFFMKRYMTQPINNNTGANNARSKAVICAVIVVPMLAPIITEIASTRLINPELTKPITIISVADELWINTVTPTPSAIPISLFEVTCSRIVLTLSPAAF